MSCCGQQRDRLRASHSPALARGSGLAPPTPPPPSGGVALRYRERARVLVRGPVTGLTYEFSASQPTRNVDARDAEALLRTRWFVRVR